MGQEIALLRNTGHTVIEYRRSNHEFDSLDLVSKARFPATAIWSLKTFRELVQVISHNKPDITHFHNTFAMVSPSAYRACKSLGVPVVQTLHNYRLLCARADLFHDNTVCERCVGKFVPWPAILHRCYRDSFPLSAGVSSIMVFNRMIGTWEKYVDAFVALTNFGKKKFVQGGVPAKKIVVKPNFVYPDPGKKDGEGEFALFAGRFSPGKGIKTMLSAWRSLPDVPLKLVGTGPESESISAFVKEWSLKGVQIIGNLPRNGLLGLMKHARMLVFPSEWYEGFPMVIAEAFASGLPVVCSRIGAPAEVVQNTHTGLNFEPGNPPPTDLAEKVRWAWSHAKEMQEMGEEARHHYEKLYSADRNHALLMDIYRMVLDGAIRSQDVADPPTVS